jgi:phospholipid-hydroperoxide glutathione peroxidase
LVANKNTIFLCFIQLSLGLRIAAFPCDQFGHQEPGNAEEIQCFVKDRKVKFDLYEKIDVNGNEAHPLFKYLKKEQGGMLLDAIKWNFTKFIVNKDGKPVDRHSPNTSPKEMEKELLKYF